MEPPPRPEAGSVVPFRGPLPRLGFPERAAILAVVLAIFLFGNGPIWKVRWSPDASILWSYAPIPLLVAFALAARRRLRLGSFLLETFLVALVKFGLTAMILIALWAGGAPPAARRTTREEFVAAHRGAARPSPTTPSDADVTARLAVGAGGMALSPPTAPAGSFLAARSADGRLHTLHAVDATGATLFNEPLLPTGAERLAKLPEAAGVVRLRCEVHPEETAALAVAAVPR